MLNITQNTTLGLTGTDIIEAKCFANDSTGTRTGRLLFYGAIILVSLVANTLAIFIVFRDKRMRKPINFFIVNMCTSDLLITVVYMPRTLMIFAVGYEWLLDGTAGLVTCKTVPFLLETATTVSILTVVVISLDRFLSVMWPLKTIISRRPARAIVAVLWLFSAAFRSPILLIKLQEKDNKLYCTLNLDKEIEDGAATVYYELIMAVLYLLPLTLIILFYSGIIVILKRKNAVRRFLRQDGRNRDARNNQILRLVMVVVAAFVVCWILYFVVMVMDTIKVAVSCEVRFARLLLAHSNCAITPCLYFLFSENYRKGLVNVRAAYTTRRRKSAFHSVSECRPVKSARKESCKNNKKNSCSLVMYSSDIKEQEGAGSMSLKVLPML